MVIEFHLDESMPGAVARGLRTRGCDVTMPAEVGLLSASDDADLEFTRKEGRLLVTADDDFLALAAYFPRKLRDLDNGQEQLGLNTKNVPRTVSPSQHRAHRQRLETRTSLRWQAHKGVMTPSPSQCHDSAFLPYVSLRVPARGRSRSARWAKTSSMSPDLCSPLFPIAKVAGPLLSLYNESWHFRDIQNEKASASYENLPDR